MDILWTPWRMAYLQNPNQEDGCMFCLQLEKPDGEENLVLYRGRQAFVILNRFPYTNGHLMVVPIAHLPSLEDLRADQMAELMELTQRSLAMLRRVYGAGSFNLGANIGQAAGAGVADHVHLHVVPRWAGDTNFMSTLANTRVLPETLEATYRRLRQNWDSGEAAPEELKRKPPLTATGPL